MKFKAAVIGKDVSKSLSPQIHGFIAERFGYSLKYDRLSISENEFDNKILGVLNEYDGLNVTIPFKLAIIPYLKNLSGDAKNFGAVNTVKTGTLEGYNTDGQGFKLMLENENVTVGGKPVLVLGAGGAGRSVAKTLSDSGATVYVYDKNYDKAVSVAEEFNVCALEFLEPAGYYTVINATGVGMHGTVGKSPVNADFFNDVSAAVDLIYSPAKSEFLKLAERAGKKIINGGGMLFYQAYYAESIFFGFKPDGVQAKNLFNEFKKVKL